MIKFIVVLLFSFPSLASEEFGLVRNGPLRALRTTKPYGPFSIQKGTLVKKVKVEKGTITNGHEAFVYYSQETGKQIPGVFHMGNKNLKDNTEFIRFDFNDEQKPLEVDTANLSCDAMMASVSEQGDGKEILLNGLSNDPSYSFEKAEMFALSGSIGDFKELEIVTREKWGAKRPNRRLSTLSNPRAIVIHHTATKMKNKTTGIQRYHQRNRGWSDIGYHYLLGWDKNSNQWKVYEGRSSKTNRNGKKIYSKGAHAKHVNSSTIGIAVIGNFSPLARDNPLGYSKKLGENRKQIPKEAIEKLAQLIKKIKKENPTIKDVMAHGSGSATVRHSSHNLKSVPGAESDCPGEGIIHIAAALGKRYFSKK